MLPRQARRQEVMANRAEARKINAQPGIAAERQRQLQQAQQMMQGPRAPTPRPGASMAPGQVMWEGQRINPGAMPDPGMRGQPGQQMPGAFGGMPPGVKPDMGMNIDMSQMQALPGTLSNNPYDREALDRYIQHLKRYAPGGNNV